MVTTNTYTNLRVHDVLFRWRMGHGHYIYMWIILCIDRPHQVELENLWEIWRERWMGKWSYCEMTNIIMNKYKDIFVYASVHSLFLSLSVLPHTCIHCCGHIVQPIHRVSSYRLFYPVKWEMLSHRQRVSVYWRIECCVLFECISRSTFLKFARK